MEITRERLTRRILSPICELPDLMRKRADWDKTPIPEIERTLGDVNPELWKRIRGRVRKTAIT
jgi:hypothetical protein